MNLNKLQKYRYKNRYNNDVNINRNYNIER